MLLSAQHLNKSYPLSQGCRRRHKQPVIRDLSLQIARGESVGLVGESGSGKSTLARLLAGIEWPDSGSVLLDGKSVRQRQHRQGRISIVFQDYQTSVNPTMTVLQAICEPLMPAGGRIDEKTRKYVTALLQRVGLSVALMPRYLRELSGGQAQRVCLCRALINHPSLIILDEATSSLDIVSQVQLLDLLLELKREFNLSYLFISHNIQVLCYVCDSILFLAEGKIVEQRPVSRLAEMETEYAKRLLRAVV
ncbi:dipeptide/oligopeptide/nickel ABC transporter ATP-binding protein [Pasteurellaceae bacterium LIM206]|nr:dipeptide/oligopeptide/nickel ABC transporter ATP-binding protein [Pasteurellaceae bacterium LIM206]